MRPVHGSQVLSNCHSRKVIVSNINVDNPLKRHAVVNKRPQQLCVDVPVVRPPTHGCVRLCHADGNTIIRAIQHSQAPQAPSYTSHTGRATSPSLRTVIICNYCKHHRLTPVRWSKNRTPVPRTLACQLVRLRYRLGVGSSTRSRMRRIYSSFRGRPSCVSMSHMSHRAQALLHSTQPSPRNEQPPVAVAQQGSHTWEAEMRADSDRIRPM